MSTNPTLTARRTVSRTRRTMGQPTKKNVPASISRIKPSDSEEMKTLKKLFRQIDEDNSDSIEIEEFGKIFRSFGITNVTEEQLHELMRDADTDRDGHVSFEEFENFVRRRFPDLLIPIEQKRAQLILRMKDLFTMFDQDGDGTISPDELKYVVRQLSKRGISEEELEILVRSVDSDQNGFIDFEEFEDMMTKNQYIIGLFDELLKSDPLHYLKAFLGIPAAFRRSYLSQLKLGGGGLHHVRKFIRPTLNTKTGLDYTDCMYGFSGGEMIEGTTKKTAVTGEEELFGVYPLGGTFSVQIKRASSIPLPTRDVLERKAYICVYDDEEKNAVEDQMLYSNLLAPTATPPTATSRNNNNNNNNPLRESTTSTMGGPAGSSQPKIVSGGVVSNILELKALKHRNRDDSWSFPTTEKEKIIVRLGKDKSTYSLYIELVIVVNPQQRGDESFKEISCGFIRVKLNKSFFLKSMFKDSREKLIGGTIKEPQMINLKDVSTKREDLVGNLLNSFVGIQPPSVVIRISTVDNRSALKKYSFCPPHIIFKKKSLLPLTLYRKGLAYALLKKQNVEEERNTIVLCDPLFSFLPKLFEDDEIWDVFIEEWNRLISTPGPPGRDGTPGKKPKSYQERISVLRNLVVSMYPVLKCATKPRKDYEEVNQSKYVYFVRSFVKNHRNVISNHFFKPFDCEELSF